MVSRTKTFFSSVFFVVFVFICVQFYRKDHILNTRQNPKQSDIQLGLDTYCLNTIKSVAQKDNEGNFVIPENTVLSDLPLDILDCLYQRYTTSLQAYCSRQDKHGSCLSGLNVCVDVCYKPTNETVIRVLSGREPYSDTVIQGVANAYHNRVFNYAPNAFGEGIKTEFIRASNQLQHQRYTFTDDIHQSEITNDVLIIDVGDLTKQTIDFILENGFLKYFKQISFRIKYIDSAKSRIDYVSALYHLKQLYASGFRIYWYEMEWNCLLKRSIHRTSCVTINWIHKNCENKALSNNHPHLTIPDEAALSRFNADQGTLYYYRYLTSIQTHCKEIIRLGGIIDGGWEVCNDAKYRPQQSCLVYSFGINWDFKFDDAIAEAYGCEVHSFDPSMKKEDFQHSSKVSFHNIGLLNENVHDVKTGWKLSTLKGIRDSLGHLYRKIDIIKIDIENSEWKAIPEMIQSGALRDVLQLYIEFHSEGAKQPLHHLRVLRLLYDEGFRIFWYHRNPNCCSNDKLPEYSFCNEVYFIRE